MRGRVTSTVTMTAMSLAALAPLLAGLLVEHASASRAVGTLISNGDFDEYWEHHLRQEHQRIHQARYQDDVTLAA